MHPPGDGRFGNAEDGGGLGVGQLLTGDQHGGIAQCRLQPRNRALDPDGVVEVAAVRRRSNADENRQLFGKCAEGAAPSPPIAAGVEGDPAKPGAELGLSTESADLFDQSTANVLRNVVGIGARASQLPGETMNAVVVALEKRGKGFAITGDRGSDETGIWIATALCHPLLPMTPTELRREL